MSTPIPWPSRLLACHEPCPRSMATSDVSVAQAVLQPDNIPLLSSTFDNAMTADCLRPAACRHSYGDLKRRWEDSSTDFLPPVPKWLKGIPDNYQALNPFEEAMRTRRDSFGDPTIRQQKIFPSLVAAAHPERWYDRLNQQDPGVGVVSFTDGKITYEDTMTCAEMSQMDHRFTFKDLHQMKVAQRLCKQNTGPPIQGKHLSKHLSRTLCCPG
ncbi:MAG: hypothetical protein Q9179_004273 [Wetmoreana sp. 5 TL-2023]